MRRYVLPILLMVAVVRVGYSQGIYGDQAPKLKKDIGLDLRTPADQTLLAAKDIVQYPKEVAVFLRYLDMASIHPDERENAYLVMCGHMQHISRASSIIRPEVVPGSKGSLLRINLYDYGIDVKVWEQLAVVEPYYHVQAKFVTQKIEKVITKKTEKEAYYWPGGVSKKDGYYYPAGTYYKDVVKEVVTEKVVGENIQDKKGVPAPWVVPTPFHQKAQADLFARTYSEVPIVRADWFFNQSAAQVDRKPGYYDFLGIKNLKDFEKLVGFSQKVSDEAFKVELRASVADSGVSLQPRAIARYPAADSGYWKTYDYRIALGNKNPLNVFLKDIEKEFDATETIGFGPTYFLLWGAFNQKGERQDTVPDFIAPNHMARGNDKRIHPNMSCVECHYESGFKPIDDWARNMLTPPPEFVFGSTDYNKVKDFREQYTKKLEPWLDKDRKLFEEAVKTATGWTTKAYSKAYADFWYRFENAKVNLAWAERDTGLPQDLIVKAIDWSIKANKGDVILSALLKKNGTIVPVRQWLDRIPTLYDTVKGYETAKQLGGKI